MPGRQRRRARSTSSSVPPPPVPRTPSRTSSWARPCSVAGSATTKASNGLQAQTIKSDPNAIGYASFNFTNGLHRPLPGRPLHPAQRQVGPVRRHRNFCLVRRGAATGSPRSSSTSRSNPAAWSQRTGSATRAGRSPRWCARAAGPARLLAVIGLRTSARRADPRRGRLHRAGADRRHDRLRLPEGVALLRPQRPRLVRRRRRRRPAARGHLQLARQPRRLRLHAARLAAALGRPSRSPPARC